MSSRLNVPPDGEGWVLLVYHGDPKHKDTEATAHWEETMEDMADTVAEMRVKWL